MRNIGSDCGRCSHPRIAYALAYGSQFATPTSRPLTLISLERINLCKVFSDWAQLARPHHHNVRRFHQSRGDLAFLQAHFPHGVGGDDGGEALAGD